MTVRSAYIRGVRAARAKFGGALGATIDVQPKDFVGSHGTQPAAYAPRTTSSDGTDSQSASVAANRSDKLWDEFNGYNRAASGCADGSFGEEVIG